MRLTDEQHRVIKAHRQGEITERERIKKIINDAPRKGKSRFIDREWLLRQIEKD